MVVIDFDNISKSLKERLGCNIVDLMKLINYTCSDLDNLTGIVNRDSRSFSPIILIISEKTTERKRIKQNILLSRIKELSSISIEVFTIKPKRINSGSLVSCTDSDVAVFLSMALNDKKIKRVILFSGDGDFKRSLRWTGTRGKKVELVCVTKTDSSELKDHVLLLGGTVSIVGKDIITIFKDEKKIQRRGEIPGLAKIIKPKKIESTSNDGGKKKKNGNGKSGKKKNKKNGNGNRRSKKNQEKKK